MTVSPLPLRLMSELTMLNLRTSTSFLHESDEPARQFVDAMTLEAADGLFRQQFRSNPRSRGPGVPRLDLNTHPI